jgi:DNA-binding beta-propeller fold protein YncE
VWSRSRTGARALFAAVVCAALVVPTVVTRASPVTDPLPGDRQLPNGWTLRPAGTQILVQRGPTGVAVAPTGTVYAVTSGIFEEAVESIDPSTLTATPTLVSSAFQGVAADAAGNVWVSGGPNDDVLQYRAVGPALVDERQAGPAPATPNRGIPVTGYPGTMLLSGHRLFVAGTLSVPTAVATAAGAAGGCADSAICSVVTVLDVSNPSPLGTPPTHAIAVGRDAYGLAYRPDSSTLYVSNWADGTNPARAGGTGTVSVVHVDADGTGSETQVVPVGQQPMGIALSPDGHTLAVANSASDTVSLLTVGTDGAVTGATTVPVGVRPGAPLGTTPIAVAFTPDGRYLLVALAGLNAVEVLTAGGQPIPQWVTVPYDDRPTTVRSPATYIPTGWYPDALALGPDPTGAGTRLYVANLNGEGAGPGYYGQLQPVVGSSTEGSVSAIDLSADPTTLAHQLQYWTARAVANDQLAAVDDAALPDPATDACLPATLPDGQHVLSGLLCAAQRGELDRSTLHVVEILAENKTYDSYFGDTRTTFRNSNADPQWTEYGLAVTTNQHRLAREYSLSDNFWNEGAESSVLGHSWWAGGIATPDNMLTWGQDYDQGLRGNRSGGQYGPSTLGSGDVTSASISGAGSAAVAAQEAQLLSPSRYLVDVALQHGLSVRVYGTDLVPGSAARPWQVPQALWGEGPGSPVSSDLGMPDVDRARLFLYGHTTSHAWDLFDGPPPKTFLKPVGFTPTQQATFAFSSWESHYYSCRAAGGTDASCQSAMPNFLYLQLPENHTYDISNVFNPLDPTPQSMVADNDYAIGLIVQALSHSPFWKNTAVFISEDDDQFTGDHVDIHRTFLLTMGGLARRLGPEGLVDTEQASFVSVLKTIEVLFGLPALTLFDWRATPLQNVMAATADGRSLATYQAVRPPTPFLGHP